MADKFILLNLESDVHRYVEKFKPRGWKEGHCNKLDWSRVECHISGKAEYLLDGSASSSGSFTARTQTLKNGTSKDQELVLKESVARSHKVAVDVYGGVCPGSAPVDLQLPSALTAHGLPPSIPIAAQDGAGGQLVEWKVAATVSVPKKSSVVATVSGSELRSRGTFAQKTRLEGIVLVRHYDERGVFYTSTEVSLDELLEHMHGPNTKDIRLYPGGFEYTLRGTCRFLVAVDSVVELKEVK